MIRLAMVSASILGLCFLSYVPLEAGKQDTGGVKVDKEKKTITIDAKIAKLPIYEKAYPIEVIACYPHPKGKKAHETVVTIDVKPSYIHKCLVDLGLKLGVPVMGGKDEPKGPEVNVYIEVPDGAGGQKETDHGQSSGRQKWPAVPQERQVPFYRERL